MNEQEIHDLQVIQQLNENLRQFNTNYMVLQDYLDDALEKLKSISTTAIEVNIIMIMVL